MIYSTLNNDTLLTKFQALLGVDITEDEQRLGECEAGIIFGRSPAFGLGTADVRKHVAGAAEAGVPCVLVLNRPDPELVAFAESHGVAGDNIVVPLKGRVSAVRVAGLLERLLQSYQLAFDDRENGLFPAVGIQPSGPVNGGRGIVLPERSCVVYGVKGGVGVSTVAAMAAANLEGGFHLEIGGPGRVPAGYCYHGPSPEQAGPGYGYWNTEGDFPILAGKTVVVDLNQSAGIGTADELISQAKCFILVADRSEVAFTLVGRLVTHGLKPDIFVVCGGLLGSVAGCPVEVYKGEYGDQLPVAVEVPGGLKTERVVLGAQRHGVPPCAFPGGEDLNLACGELVSLIRGFVG